MLIRHSVIPVCVPTVLVFAILAGLQISAPTAAHAQADSSRSQQPKAQPPFPDADGLAAVRKLFQLHCVKCHGADGTGSPARRSQPQIPNFTGASWQAQRTDAQLLASILDGKGKEMPPMRGKISEDNARGLVDYVRAFAPTAGKSPQKEREGATSFDERFRRLQEQMDELRRELRKLSEGSPSRVPAKPPESRQHKVSQPSAPTAGGTPAARGLFRQHCVKCHGADGTGNAARGRLREIPNFTDASWQAQRSDARLLASILDGKGTEMPPARSKVSEEQARGLVAYIRSFAPSTEKPPRQEEQAGPNHTFPWSALQHREESAGGEPADAKPVWGFLEKLIGWLGRFHPPTVHFPVALLTAAAVAELLGMATAKPSFDSVSRYCVWFGALTAMVAGVLGWFLGGFALSDASWIIMTHRWLGTSTVACSGLVLGLSELSRRPDRGRSRIWFRLTLLVLAVLVLVTGFFGGAVVFGLDHYTWPR
jgi:mono/diheme cytochrome c family protein/uncharacterized membrane protein